MKKSVLIIVIICFVLALSVWLGYLSADIAFSLGMKSN